MYGNDSTLTCKKLLGQPYVEGWICDGCLDSLRDYRFHLPGWSYAALSLGAKVGVRVDPPTLKSI